MAYMFWVIELQMARLQPLLPNKSRGVPRVDDRRVILGIVHVLMSGGRCVEAPAIYGLRRTLYNRWVHWARHSILSRTFEALSGAGGPSADLMLDSTHAKAHRCAAGGRRGALPQAIGRSRGGRTTKLRALVDGRGRPVAFAITPSQRGDAPVAIGLLNQPPPSRSLAADAA